jgi:hypothetical protein
MCNIASFRLFLWLTQTGGPTNMLSVISSPFRTWRRKQNQLLKPYPFRIYRIHKVYKRSFTLFTLHDQKPSNFDSVNNKCYKIYSVYQLYLLYNMKFTWHRSKSSTLTPPVVGKTFSNTIHYIIKLNPHSHSAHP